VKIEERGTAKGRNTRKLPDREGTIRSIIIEKGKYQDVGKQIAERLLKSFSLDTDCRYRAGRAKEGIEKGGYRRRKLGFVSGHR